MWENDDACIKCSICISVCPVYGQDLEFPGPKALGPDWFRAYQANPLTVPSEHVDDCTFCQLCEASCPVHVPIAHLIAQHKSLKKKTWRINLRDRILAHPHWVARYPRLANAPNFLVRPLGFGTQSRWPRPQRRVAPLSSSPQADTRQIVGLFVDCYSRGFDQDVLSAAQALLELWGFSVRLLPHASHCCGAAAYAAGQPEEGQRIARSTYDAMTPGLTDLSQIVTLNATCDSTLREEWPLYWNLSLPVPVLSFSEFALDKAPAWFWDAMHKGMTAEQEQGETTSWIHTTCRSRVSRGDGILEQLADKAGLAATQPLNLACCGAGGSYAFKEEHEKTAHALGAAALEQVTETHDRIIVDSGTCALHLTQITGALAKHPAYWLYQRFLSLTQRSGDIASQEK
ncbi:(Fe-S)-binding protein [Sulfobacillus sp. hq2]|uniref:(Fe-S)-binding protein n=1 Tax=Sulfobacillus TaxID=28033 RepID=UPI000CD17C86|nr:heterodisulfide reductase-related iron-sulfur binding cluster [Sulfobacillus sp. hq2]POB09423.1 hypothetical protein CO251_14375 [Sulfobacillus sp. hq2]